jgi:NhaA family Na+:H+ antiporter
MSDASDTGAPTSALPGLVLLAAAAVALVLAQTPLADGYEALWSTPLPLVHDLRGAVNDGLMTLFFFVVGIEIRHELQHGALNGLRRAILPLGAAMGGMIVPALIYFAFNRSGPSAAGWGIPVATDIAFALGVLTLFGAAVPSSVRAVLLALAVVDDVGAILIITIFYAGGVHPTLVGVIIGLALPAALGARIRRVLDAPVAYVVMPVFALANAGVTLRGDVFGGGQLTVLLGVTLGLALGKPLGVIAAARVLVGAGAAALPAGARWQEISTLGALAGIGFTMSLFIAQLAFPEGPLLAAAKLGIILGSVIAAALAAAVTLLRRPRLP